MGATASFRRWMRGTAMKIVSIAALAAVLALPTVSAQAKVFAFTYAAAAGTIAGKIDGVLQGDGNTVAVDKVLNFVTFNGVGDIALPWLGTADIIYGGSRAPSVTLDGSFVDFAACETEFCYPGEGVIFDPDTIAFTEPVVRTSPAFGDIVPADFNSPEPEVFQARKWTLTAVPEPSTWAMMILGFGMAGAAMRGRALRRA
jgi:hypothetical protein